MTQRADDFVYLDTDTENHQGEIVRRKELPDYAYLGAGTISVDASELDPKDTSGAKVAIEVWVVEP